jgi:hypothetical protein
MQIIDTHKSILAAFTMAGLIALSIMDVMTRHVFAQDTEKSSLVMRIAVFAKDQGQLDNYRDFIEGHLFPTLRAAPGYVSTFLGRDSSSGQLISVSFWRSEDEAVAGEEAVGRAISAIPHGSAPRPSKVEKYVVEYRDIKEPLSK